MILTVTSQNAPVSRASVDVTSPSDAGIIGLIPITDDRGQTQLIIRPTQPGDVSVFVDVSKLGYGNVTKNVFLTADVPERGDSIGPLITIPIVGITVSLLIIIPIAIAAYAIGLVAVMRRRKRKSTAPAGEDETHPNRSS